MEDYLAVRGQDRGADRRRADRGGQPRASRSSCCSTRSPTREEIQVSDDEYGHEIVHRAQRVGMAPQAYYDQLVQSGAARRRLRRRTPRQGAGLVMEKVKITDAAGNVLSLDELRAPTGEMTTPVTTTATTRVTTTDRRSDARPPGDLAAAAASQPRRESRLTGEAALSRAHSGQCRRDKSSAAPSATWCRPDSVRGRTQGLTVKGLP